MKVILQISALWLLLSAFNIVNAQKTPYIILDGSSNPAAEMNLISTGNGGHNLEFSVNAYHLKQVETGNGTANIISAPDAAKILKKGAPELPCYATSLIIDDIDEMYVEVLDSRYIEINNIDIAPSKGNLLRNVNPSDVPYVYGEEYQKNEFYPSAQAFLREPYILRDFRGQALVIQPFAYNPVTKTLRIYTQISLSLKSAGVPGVNAFNRTKSMKNIDEEFDKIYSKHFINYSDNTKYTPVSDLPGNMLIISDASFMSSVQPLVDWKILKGMPCEIVSVSTIGNNVTAIKNYVSNYYNTNGLTFLLLVGDFAQVTSPTANIGGVTGAKDNEYAFISGNDHYQEFFVGRLSAENVADVQTQVQRSVYYEKTPQSGTWYSKNIGIGSSEGDGIGDDGEVDYLHIRNMQADLLAFTYNTSVELFDGSQGGLDAAGNPTATMVSTAVNPGVGTMLYCGHGSDNSWVTTGFSSTNASALLNVNKLPFIYTVSCVVGHYNVGTCFCEAWMRAKQAEGPTGSIGIFGSTINQSWAPPMEAQDEMVDILVETYTNNIKRTFAGIGIHGCFKMNDTYADFDQTDTWTIFGDPSLMVRTTDPISMTVSHMPTMILGSNTFQVDCNVEGAYVAITYNNAILGTGYISGGTSNITLNPAPANPGEIINVCVTAFNHIPYIGTFEVVNNNIPLDAQLASIISPNGTYNCTGVPFSPTVVIKNLGTDMLTSLQVSYQIDGGTIVSQPWTGSLNTFEADTIVFPSVTMTSGSHSIRAFVSSPNGGTDGYIANDELIRTYSATQLSFSCNFSANTLLSCNIPLIVQFTNLSTNTSTYLWDFGDGNTSTQENPSHTYNSPGLYTVSLVASAGICGDFNEVKTGYIQIGADSPVVTDDFACMNQDANLSATGNGTISWFTQSTGGTSVQTGTSMTVNNVTSDVIYYVENITTGVTQYVGNLQSSASGSFFTAAVEHYLIFDCTSPTTLVSAEVNAQTSGNRIIQLRNSSNTVLQTATVNIPAGVSRITLNFNIPVGANLRLVGPASPALWRNNAGVSYPYTVSDIAITGSSAGAGYYYFFYNWEVKGPDCVSARVPVTAFLSEPAINISVVNESAPGASDGSATAVVTGNPPFTYQWSNSALTPTIENLSEGSYCVTVTDSYGCTNEACNYIWVLVSENNLEKQIGIFPVPVSQWLYISAGNLDISTVKIFDITGNEALSLKPSQKPLRIDVSSLSQGIYTIEVISEGKVFTRKFNKVD